MCIRDRENPGARELIAALAARGVAVSAGHTDAKYEQIREAMESGLTQMTHLYNCMSPLHHRAPGAVGAALTLEGLSSQVIADGIHLHPAAVKLAVRACSRVLLITDAMEAADMPDGDYDLGGQKVFVRGGAARLAAGNLAGSTLTLERGVRNAMRFAGISLEQAAVMALSLIHIFAALVADAPEGAYAKAWDLNGEKATLAVEKATLAPEKAEA